MHFKQFRDFLTEEKKNSDPIFCKYFYRPISLYLAWIIFNLGISANQVTFSSIFLTCIGSIFYCTGDFTNSIIGSIFFIFVGITDCIDGNLARAYKKLSFQGSWLDAVSGYFIYAFQPLSIAIFIERNNPKFLFSGYWILCGSLVSILNLLSRVIYQKYLNLIKTSNGKELNVDHKKDFSIGNELGLVGFMMPLLFIATLSSNLILYIYSYLIIYFFTSIYVFLSINKKIKKYL